ncbi:hypothetical protein IGB42_02633 [Andreprevotia sp. IGB-42]|uniref:phage tail tube protein n=1 Tax=Andreprevotia sp. IGB-42 TaxID=2497473 RepID=UPI00135A1FA7|nr:phage tail tube protein [Andreprevotia sp. IGB-42]KAF0812790.1 hypothetical protein IGB42_02633 [Andreprevotia sp. IGB-42]
MPGSTRVKAALLKKETTYGVDAMPVGNSNAILLRNANITPLEAKMEARDIATPALGHMEDILVGQSMLLEAELEFAGSGTLGVAPAWGLALQLCSFAEVITPDVSVEYNPISAAVPSGTIYYYYAGKLHKLLGARGDMTKISVAAGKLPVMGVKYTALYGGIATAPPPGTLDLSAWQKPEGVNKANTSMANVHGLNTPFYEFEMQLANTVVHRDLPGREDVVITDRAPVGSIVIPDPDLNSYNFFDAVRLATVGAFSFLHGTTEGNQVNVNSNYLQVTGASYEDRDKDVALKLALKFTHGPTGNNDFFIRSQ